MCSLEKLAQYSSKSLRDLRSLLLFLPSLILISTVLSSFSYSTETANVTSSYANEVISNDSDVTCYDVNSLHLGDGHTSEGYRIESNVSESSTKTIESSFKCLAQRNTVVTLTRNYYFINYCNSCKDAALTNMPVIFHQLLI